jgi:hypothetical protein
MLLVAPATAQLPPGLPRLAIRQVKPGSAEVWTTLCWPGWSAFVCDANELVTDVAFEHGTLFATTIHGCPAAMTMPQLVDARASETPPASRTEAAVTTSNAASLIDRFIRMTFLER